MTTELTEATVQAGEEKKDFNLIQVTVADVAKYAKKTCRTCFGAGLLKVTRKTQVEKKFTGPAVEHTEPCACAMRQFHKRATYVIDHHTGNYFFVQPK